jgi:hypothetical protein
MDGNSSKNTPREGQEIPRVAVYETSEGVDVNDTVDTRVQTAPNVTETRERYEDTVVRSNGDRSPDEIERDIEHTQERIADSIDELAKRLNPSHIKDQAVQSLNDSLNLGGLGHMVKDIKGSLTTGARDSGVKVLEGVKHNPLSSALIGVGVGVVALGGILAARSEPASYQASSRQTKNPKIYDERLRGMMEAVENKHDNTYEEDTSGVRGKLESAKHVVSDKAQQAKELSMQGAQMAKDGFGRALEAQPLAIGAVALLAGAAVGLLLPRTRYEDSWMGEKSDQLIAQAKGRASEYVDVAKSTASDVLNTAKDTAKEVVQTTKDAAKEAVKV